MRQLMLFLTCAVAAVMLGCVPSLQPLVTDEKELIFEPNLVGTWIKPDSRTSFKLEKGVAKAADNSAPTTGEGGDKAYTITATDDDGNVAKLVGGLVRLDNTLFFNTTVLDSGVKGFTSCHMLPVHLFTRITLDGDTLTYATLDAEWMKKQHAEKKLAIRHELVNDTVVLTASTPEIREFLRKNAGNPDAFQKPTELKRKK
jgi:hypothetical protein